MFHRLDAFFEVAHEVFDASRKQRFGAEGASELESGARVWVWGLFGLEPGKWRLKIQKKHICKCYQSIDKHY